MILKNYRKRIDLWLRCFSLVLLFTLGFQNMASASDYPNKPIQLVVAYPPGGGADTTARMIVDKLSSLLGQPVVVVNKPGGGAVVGTAFAKAAKPDGYTIFSAQPPMLRHHLTTKGITHDLIRDFIPLNLTVSCNMVTVVKYDAPWSSLKELIAEAKKNPGKLAFSTPGYGSSAHFTMEMLKLETGTDFTHVPFDGSAPAIAAVIGGHTNVFVAEVGLVSKHLEAKTLRALAVWSKKRDKAIPPVPTTAEEGFPNLFETSWQAYFVPQKTPKEIVGRLEKAFMETLSDKKIIESYEKIGWIVENLDPQETADLLAKSQKKYGDIAKAINMVPK